MENTMGKICPFCQTEIKEGEAVMSCPACGNTYHANCWQQNGGCCVPGCPDNMGTDVIAPAAEPVAEPVQVPVQAPAVPTNLCPVCSTALDDTQMFCPNCGTAKVVAPQPQANICSNCRTELMPGQEFCPTCGQKAGLFVDPGVNAAINNFNTNVQNSTGFKLKMPHIIGIAVAAVVVIAVIIIIAVSGGGGKKGPNFNALYTQYCSSTWADVGTDGSYLSIDTNPYDWDDDGLAYPEAYDAVEDINNALGLPQSLMTSIGQTSGADGRQTETFAAQGVIVTWKYHPDSGLELTYKHIN